ncbi:MAG: acetyl-CoA acetyltransferase [Chloroflexi bacterium]|jgi:acetyl-CoA C-acetyltransferase|nr:acetyl-CoA acetyltransferase [Chloroflexota bacterium]
MAEGIRDKVAILGMGCTRFGERWEVGAEDLMVEAFVECLEDAGIEKKDIEAAYVGTCYDEVNIGKGAVTHAEVLKLPHVAVTRTENFCATAQEALRAASYAVAAGAFDIVLALGVEKLKDTGFAGLPIGGGGAFPRIGGYNGSGPQSFAQLAHPYAKKYGLEMDKVKEAMAHISVKSHANGAMNPRAHLRFPITQEQVLNAPIISYPLGLFDCCGVSDGAAAAIVTTPEIARSLKPNQDLVKIKSIQVSVANGEETLYNSWDGAGMMTAQVASTKAYAEAGIKNPREEINMMEVHDCFSITELILMENLGISAPGGAYEDIMSGFFDLNGKIPCQVDGGLKCFGHPIGASGLRMVYAVYEQLLERVPEERKVNNVRTGLIHNLGGEPAKGVVSVGIFGRD